MMIGIYSVDNSSWESHLIIETILKLHSECDI